VEQHVAEFSESVLRRAITVAGNLVCVEGAGRDEAIAALNAPVCVELGLLSEETLLRVLCLLTRAVLDFEKVYKILKEQDLAPDEGVWAAMIHVIFTAYVWPLLRASQARLAKHRDQELVTAMLTQAVEGGRDALAAYTYSLAQVPVRDEAEKKERIAAISMLMASFADNARLLT
jgi:hypothetical protein